VRGTRHPGSVGFADVAYPKQGFHGGFTEKATSSTFGTGHEGHSTAHQILWAEIQNNGTQLEAPAPTYTDPIQTATTIANCDTSTILPSEEGFPFTTTGSWHGVLASDPKVSEHASAADYPICQLTYDLVWNHYSASKLYGTTEAAHEVANTVRDLFEYIILGRGQNDIPSHEYTRIVSGFVSHVNNMVEAIKY
jgi:hypothetical protein